MMLANNNPVGQIGITWQLSEYHGWGVFGLNLVKSLIQLGYPVPTLLQQPNINLIDAGIKPAVDLWLKNKDAINQSDFSELNLDNLTTIHSFGNDFQAMKSGIQSKKNIGFIFYESLDSENPFMALIVHKYGGTSMGSTDRIRNVAKRVAKWARAGHQMVVVPSAMSGETNRLLGLAKELAPAKSSVEYNRELDMLAATGEPVDFDAEPAI